MKAASSSSAFLGFFAFELICGLLLSIGMITSCGSNRATPPAPKLSGTTSVTVLLSSTANDQLSQFNLTFRALTLTSQSGKTVSLLSAQQPSELIHLNGGIEPLVTVTVPQDVYTAATATIGSAAFTCVTLLPQGSAASLGISMYAYGQTPDGNVTVNLPSPITVTGKNMAMALDLLVSQSASFPSECQVSGTSPYSITPTFNLSPVTLAAQPSGSGNGGNIRQLDGQIATITPSSNGLTLSLSQPTSRNTTTLSATANGSTVYQGINDFSALAVGMFVDMDGAIQGDGSVLASRIAVEDPTAVDVMLGPVLGVFPSQPAVNLPSAVFFSRLSMGLDPVPLGWAYGISEATFRISQQFNNLPSLPFVPSFNASNMVAGQYVYVSSQDLSYFGGIYTPATTIVLMPQTINGTVVGSAKIGNFTDYTVSLASYDLFPILAVQQGQTTLLNNPSQVEVYVDSSTQTLNTQALAPGGTLRFYGLVFNDNGTLRMDCAQVNDGVPTSSSSSSTLQGQAHTQVLRLGGPGNVQMVTTAN